MSRKKNILKLFKDKKLANINYERQYNKYSHKMKTTTEKRQLYATVITAKYY